MNKKVCSEMTTPAEKLRLVKMYGLIVQDGKEWIFKSDPTKSGNIIELRDASKWCLTERVYDLIRDIKIYQ